MERLNGGLYVLQLIDFIIVDVCGAGAQSIKQRVHQILNQRKASVKTIRNVIREYAGTLGTPKVQGINASANSTNK